MGVPGLKKVRQFLLSIIEIGANLVLYFADPSSRLREAVIDAGSNSGGVSDPAQG